MNAPFTQTTNIFIKKEGEAHTVYMAGKKIGRVYRTAASGNNRWQAAAMPPSYREFGRAGTLKAAATLLATVAEVQHSAKFLIDREELCRLYNEACHGAGAEPRQAARSHIEAIAERAGLRLGQLFDECGLDLTGYFASRPINAPFTAPTHWPDVLVLFEDVDLHPDAQTPFTWRVDIAYQDADNWIVADVQLDAWGKGWIDLPAWHPLRPVLVARTQARDLREKIDAAILDDMERRGVRFDDGWGRGVGAV